MPDKSLKQKAVSGILWTTAQRFSSIFIQFLSGIVLARLLSPEDYGCIGMLAIFMLLASTFTDGGFGSALIQKKNPTQEDYSTIFYWNVALSIVIYLILFLFAPKIASFYNMELLCPVLRIQGLVVIINAFQVVQIARLNKLFQFKKISIVTLLSSVVSLTTTIVLAYRGFGVWSLVVQNLLMVLVPTLIYWATNKWKPALAFSKKSFKELFNFGVFMFLTTLLSTFVNNVQGLLIGKLYSPSTMGYYSKAQSTEKLAATSLSQVISQVSYPLYAELQDDKERLIGVIKKLALSTAFMTFPLMLLLVLVAKPVFILLYSEKWIPAVPFFQILCIAGLAICLQAVNSQAIAAVGKSKAMFNWSVVKQFTGLGFMLAGFYMFGMKGLLIGMVMKSWLIFLINAALVSRFIGYRLTQQLLDLLPVLLLSLASFLGAYYVVSLVEFSLYVEALISAFIFGVIYFAGAVAAKLYAFALCKDLLSPYLKKFLRMAK